MEPCSTDVLPSRVERRPLLFERRWEPEHPLQCLALHSDDAHMVCVSSDLQAMERTVRLEVGYQAAAPVGHTEAEVLEQPSRLLPALGSQEVLHTVDAVAPVATGMAADLGEKEDSAARPRAGDVDTEPVQRAAPLAMKTARDAPVAADVEAADLGTCASALDAAGSVALVEPVVAAYDHVDRMDLPAEAASESSAIPPDGRHSECCQRRVVVVQAQVEDSVRAHSIVGLAVHPVHLAGMLGDARPAAVAFQLGSVGRWSAVPSAGLSVL